jgi:hypothetical protein
MRLLVAATMFVAAPAFAPAQTTAPATRAVRKPPEPVVWRLRVTPAAEAVPAFRHHLVYRMVDQQPGNAATLYGGAIYTSQRKSDDADRVESLLSQPMGAFDAEAARKLLDTYTATLEQLELAARRESCDWGTPLREQGIAALLPHLGEMRSLSRLVALRVRVSAAGGKFDDAVRWSRVGYAMSKHVGTGATLVEALVSVAVGSRVAETQRDMLTRPGCPNFYWPLTEVASEFNVAHALRGEQAFVYFSIPLLAAGRDADNRTEDEWRRILMQMADLQRFAGAINAPQPSGQQLALAAVLSTQVPAARELLVKRYGFDKAKVDAMPAPEAVGRTFVLQYQEMLDEMNKWWLMPYPQAAAGMRDAELAIQQARTGPMMLNPLLVLTPSLNRARFTFARYERELAAMRVIESIRAYAAAHNGAAPDSLDALPASMPPPLDPVHLKPFEYAKTADGFTLTSPPPDPSRVQDSLRVEVTIVK